MRTIFLHVLLILFLPVASFPQQQRPPAAGGENATELIRLKAQFPINVRKHYLFEHRTEVTRKYADGNTVVFQTSFIASVSLQAVENTNDGFVTVSVNIDSIKYFYKDPEIEISYNSEKDFPPPIAEWQFLWTTIPYGREWFQTYSPYGDVAVITSPAREHLYRQLADSSAKMDTVTKFLWRSAICDERLLFLGDITRHLLPQTLVSWQQEWFRSVLFEADKMLFASNAAVQVTPSDRPGEYLVVASSDSLTPIFSSTITPGYEDQLSTAEILNGYQTHQLRINQYGTIREASGKLAANVRITTANRVSFLHEIESEYMFQLQGQYRW